VVYPVLLPLVKGRQRAEKRLSVLLVRVRGRMMDAVDMRGLYEGGGAESEERLGGGRVWRCGERPCGSGLLELDRHVVS
jgi:hypothetical protein